MVSPILGVLSPQFCIILMQNWGGCRPKRIGLTPRTLTCQVVRGSGRHPGFAASARCAPEPWFWGSAFPRPSAGLFCFAPFWAFRFSVLWASWGLLRRSPGWSLPPGLAILLFLTGCAVGRTGRRVERNGTTGCKRVPPARADTCGCGLSTCSGASKDDANETAAGLTKALWGEGGFVHSSWCVWCVGPAVWSMLVARLVSAWRFGAAPDRLFAGGSRGGGAPGVCSAPLGPCPVVSTGQVCKESLERHERRAGPKTSPKGPRMSSKRGSGWGACRHPGPEPAEPQTKVE